MTYGIGGTCAPGVLMGVAAGGVTPPTAITLYYDATLFHRTSSRVGIDGTQNVNWGVTIGVPDVITGLGQYGMAWNAGAETANNVPPAGAYSTFQTSMQNVAGGVSMEIDAADYWTNWSSFPGGYPDLLNYGGYADGGLGTGVTWLWSVTILGFSLSGGTAFISGTPVAAVDGSFLTNGWTGVGEYIEIVAGRSGGPLPGDYINVEVTATATNAGGSTSATMTHDVIFI